ncbi:5'/3'-nucleotidase SurE [Paractinoplanes deccanensis]|uniref:5'-nucleotidase n=1 Tax=Paractinoplanes deccanensis TaxID=113561 RepID=A0ABQ3Y939_9ACTN|nr:5'/3'-nucleotidase SurE [Actinoplanes deccanensis]GID76499.1 5'/3'-nucleotidase SurE [Actinoplanes deccanensis]
MSARILVTNDDGVRAPGIRALALAAHEAGYDVVVAAPREEASGMSAALTAVTSEGRIVVERHDWQDLVAYGVTASPAYITVLAGLGVFGEPPDLVLSGINRGANAGRAVLHSGTVGAALTAANDRVRAMAVSLDVLSPSDVDATASGGAAIVVPDDSVLHWETAARTAADLLDWLTEAPAGTVLNLNVPDRSLDEVAGLREATLAPFGQAQMALAESGEGFVRTAIEKTGEPLVPGSDIALLAEGYATVTAIRPPSEISGVRLPAQRRSS